MWSEPDIVGWLDKRGGKFKSWKKRFFVLQGSYLFYFENDFKIQAKSPLGVIPLDASKVDMETEESGDASRRYIFSICLGKQFLGYSKRDTYVVAAPSHQALEEWVQQIKTAAETREVLLDQLRKARWRGGDLRRMLAKSMGNREMLEYGACGPEGQALMRAACGTLEHLRRGLRGVRGTPRLEPERNDEDEERRVKLLRAKIDAAAREAIAAKDNGCVK
ncbi:hypothetical protein L7F22_021324 [Adiantum nelumboides]|nr:hypothetical protein [Adiantum nelumboides]